MNEDRNALLAEDPVIRRITAWAEQRPDIRAVILTSTRAATGKPADEFSDYDIILVVNDIRDYLDDSWLADFGEILTVYHDPVREEFGFERFTRVTQYEDGLKIDFSVCASGWLQYLARQTDLPDELDIGYRVLMDKDGLSEGLPPFTLTAYLPQPPSGEDYQTCVMNFFSNASYVGKQLCRGDYFGTIATLDDMMKLFRLRQMLEWKLGIDSDWKIPNGNLGKGMKKRLDPETWAEFEATWAGPSPEDRWNALFSTISLFVKIAREVGQNLGFVFPEELAERNIAYLQRVKAEHETQ